MAYLIQIITPYLTRPMLTVLAMGFASGLPYLLVGGTLAAWLQESGVDRATIGVFAWVAIPYSFNFLWAPVMDHVKLPLLHRLGRRRSWLLMAQFGVIVAIGWLSTMSPTEAPELLGLAALLLAFFSASQDVVVDAYRAEILKEEEYGEGAAAAVFGYRMGLLLAGAGALALADSVPWNEVYAIMAGGMVFSMGVSLLALEPEASSRILKGASADAQGARHIIRHAIIEPFKDFMQRHPGWVYILLFILAYRIPDGFIGFMVNPFLLDIGYEKLQIASIAKLFGFGATMAGMFIGGALIRLCGIQKCLLWFLLYQMVTNLAYIGLALHGEQTPSTTYLMVAISLDNSSGGMITGAAIAYMMSLVNKEFTATQYALLASLASFSSKVLAGSAGVIADAHGWAAMFAVSALMGIPALWLLRKL